MKYKQTIIPKVYTKDFKGFSPLKTRRLIDSSFKENLLGKCVTNLHKNIVVCFSRVGSNKLAFGGSVYPKKACLVTVLSEIVKYGEFVNFGKPKDTDKENVLGFLNFKCKVLIDGIQENIRFNVQLRNDGKFYYNHEVNIYKK